jgi:hypothetical protein
MKNFSRLDIRKQGRMVANKSAAAHLFAPFAKSFASFVVKFDSLNHKGHKGIHEGLEGKLLRLAARWTLRRTAC